MLLLRTVGPPVALFYCVSAFKEGLRGNTFWLFLDCIIASLYIFTAAKAHSGVKATRRSRYND